MNVKGILSQFVLTYLTYNLLVNTVQMVSRLKICVFRFKINLFCDKVWIE